MRRSALAAAVLLIAIGVLLHVLPAWPNSKLRPPTEDSPRRPGDVGLAADTSTIALNLRPRADNIQGLYFAALDELPELSVHQWLDRDPARDPNAADLVRQLDRALALFHQAAQQPHGRWTIDYEHGKTFWASLDDVLTSVSSAAAYRAKWRIMNGDFTGAQADLRDLIAMSRQLDATRHVSFDNQASYIRSRAIAAVASNWYVFDESTAGQFQMLLNDAVAQSPLAALYDEDSQAWRDRIAQGIAQRTDDPKEFRKWSAGFLDVGLNPLTGAPDPAPDLGAPEKFLTALDHAMEAVQVAASVADGPRDIFDSTLNQLREEALHDPARRLSLERLFVVRLLRSQRDENEVAVAMFRAALAHRFGGPEEFAAVRDPVGDGPFKVVLLADGVSFRLESKLAGHGSAWSMDFGPIPQSTNPAPASP